MKIDKLLILMLFVTASKQSYALVLQITNKTDIDLTLVAKNDNNSCETYTRRIKANGGYQQIDWRAGCTNSCVRSLTITGEPYYKGAPEFAPMRGTDCKTQKIQIDGGPYKNMARITVSSLLGSVDFLT